MGWGPKAPNMDGMNQAAVMNAGLAREQAALAREELAVAKERQAMFDPKFMEILNAQLASQQTSDDRSAKEWAAYEQDFLPAQHRLAETAATYDTAGRRDAAGAEARAGVAREAALAREEQNRSLGRAGISLSSGRALTLDRASRLAESKMAAGAERAARNQVEATGMSLTDNVVKTGRGLASTGLQAAQLALQAGGGATGTLGGQQGTYNASLAPAMGAFGGALSASNSAGALHGQMAGLKLQNRNLNMGMFKELAEMGGEVAGMLMFGSSKDVKEPIADVDGKAARSALEGAPVRRWKYKPGHGDGGEHIGRYAEDIPGGPMGGKAIDVISELGLHHAAISDLSREVRDVKRLAHRGMRSELEGSRA